MTLSRGATFALLLASSFVMAITIFTAPVLLGLLLVEWGKPASVSGSIGLFTGIALLLVMPLLPVVLRRWQTGQVIIWSCALIMLGLLLQAIAPNLPLLFLGRMVCMLGLALNWPVVESWVNQTAAPSQRGRDMGLYALTWGLAHPVGPWLQSHFASWGQQGFYLLAAIMLGALLLVLPLWRMPRAVDAPPKSLHLGTLRLAPALFFAGLMAGAIEGCKAYLLPAFATAHGLGDVAVYGKTAMLGLGYALLVLPLTCSTDHLPLRRVLVCIAAAGAFLSLALPLAMGTGWQANGLMLLWGAAIMSLYPLATVWAGRVVAPDRLLEVNTALAVAYTLGMMVGPYPTGVAMDLSSAAAYPIALAGFCALVALSSFLSRAQKAAH